MVEFPATVEDNDAIDGVITDCDVTMVGPDDDNMAVLFKTGSREGDNVDVGVLLEDWAIVAFPDDVNGALNVDWVEPDWIGVFDEEKDATGVGDVPNQL
jgi:hypothetical protein